MFNKFTFSKLPISRNIKFKTLENEILVKPYLDKWLELNEKQFLKNLMILSIKLPFININGKNTKITVYIAVFNIYFDGIERETLKTSKLLKQLFTNIKILSIIN